MPDLLDALMLVAGTQVLRSRVPLDDLCLYGASANYQMLELAFTRATSASWLLKQPDKQETTKDSLARPHFKVLVKSRRQRQWKK
jgi:hypothetical protein